ncbi:MAG: hypothetical protein J0L99_10915 [Chitinophagales bacterium]|jgi:hypothetical protein|nr:hypothetical protein [Chitinophagales bacterium]
MKISPLIALFLFILPSFAQSQVAVELERVNVLYAGLENPLLIVSDSIPDSCITVKIRNGQIKKREPYHFYIIVATDTSNVQLILIDTCQQQVIGERIYRVKDIPIVPLLGAQHASKRMTVGEFKAQSGIAAVITHGVCGNCAIEGFRVHLYQQRTGACITRFNTGARFSETVAALTQQVQVGDVVRFSVISYRCPGMRVPKFADQELVFEIVNSKK